MSDQQSVNVCFPPGVTNHLPLLQPCLFHSLSMRASDILVHLESSGQKLSNAHPSQQPERQNSPALPASFLIDVIHLYVAEVG